MSICLSYRCACHFGACLNWTHSSVISRSLGTIPSELSKEKSGQEQKVTDAVGSLAGACECLQDSERQHWKFKLKHRGEMSGKKCDKHVNCGLNTSRQYSKWSFRLLKSEKFRVPGHIYYCYLFTDSIFISFNYKNIFAILDSLTMILLFHM